MTLPPAFTRSSRTEYGRMRISTHRVATPAPSARPQSGPSITVTQDETKLKEKNPCPLASKLSRAGSPLRALDTLLCAAENIAKSDLSPVANGLRTPGCQTPPDSIFALR